VRVKRASRARAEVAIIGGSGLYAMEGFQRLQEVTVRTPFGRPSDALVLGTLDGTRVAFLARHGRGHRLAPGEVNYRANIYALKSVGVGRIFSVSAVGSMKEQIAPGHVVLPDQFIDSTKRRSSTFFEDGIVAHVSMAQPICAQLSSLLASAAGQIGATVHRGGTYLCMEGPQFSSKAESLLYRRWGVDVIGMTNMPEAKLAREAEICYATMALPTDYDCWHESEAAVSVDAILETLQKNMRLATQILKVAVGLTHAARSCSCGTALQHAILTAPEAIPPAAKRRLSLLIDRVLHAKNGAP
jgi:5'-methylthioadenosine phosphorylase